MLKNKKKHNVEYFSILMLIAMLANEIIKAIKVITSMLANRELNCLLVRHGYLRCYMLNENFLTYCFIFPWPSH